MRHRLLGGEHRAASAVLAGLAGIGAGWAPDLRGIEPASRVRAGHRGWSEGSESGRRGTSLAAARRAGPARDAGIAERALRARTNGGVAGVVPRRGAPRLAAHVSMAEGAFLGGGGRKQPAL